MQATLYQIMSAVPAIQKLSKCDLEGFHLFDLIALTNKLQPHINDYNECSSRLIKKHGGEFKNGKLEFAVEESEQAANIEHRGLLDKEIEVEMSRVQIPISKDIKLSASDVGVLTPFVEFVRESGE